MSACREYLPGANPRTTSCCRCGRAENAHARPAPEPAAQGVHRDPSFEEQALRLIAQRSANPEFQRLTSERLDWGDVEHGATRASWDADGVREAMDEAVDGPAWLLLHVQNTDLDGDARELVMRACIAFAEAHRWLQAVRQLEFA